MMIDIVLLAALVGLLIAAFLDSRPHLQLALAAALEQPGDRRPLKVLGYFFARKSSGGSKRRGTKRRISSNEWELRTELPRALDGSRRRTYEKFVGTSREADRRLAEILDETDSLDKVERPETIDELLDRWLASEVEPMVREVTYLDYKRRADTYVRPLIGKLKLKNLTLAKAEDFRNELLRRKVQVRNSSKGKRRGQAPRPISETTVNGALKVLSMALNYARRHKFVATNVLHDLKRRQDDPVEPKKRALSAAELAAFMEAARGNYWYSLFALLASTGLRPSEALGLSWKHVDFDGGWIHVERKLTLLPGGLFQFDPPKTKSSKRKVPISPGLERILLEHLSRQEELRAYDESLDLVFCDLAGQPADSRNILNRHVKPIAAKAGIRGSVTLYSFRHTFMTLSTNDTRAPKLTSRVMGHKDVAFSQNVYEDPDDEALRQSTLPMDAFLGDGGDDYEEGAVAAD